MKKAIVIAMIIVFACGMMPTISQAREPGGGMGFLVGCCFGLRTGAAWNEGKDLFWRDWGTIIPVFGYVVMIMNGIDSSKGMTTADLSAKYGSQYY